MNRRDFLLLTGAAGGALALTPMVGQSPFPAEVVEEAAPGVESWTSTTCLMCSGGCGLRVRSVDGFPVGVKGNPNHPMNAGGACSEGIVSLQLLYHPDRLLQPMRRNRRGSGTLEPARWDDALRDITAALKRLQEKGEARKLAFVLGRSGGSMEALIRHFMSTIGSSKVLMDQPEDGYAKVFEIMHGLGARPAFDFDNTDVILSFGADLLDSWQAPLQFQRSYSNTSTASRSSSARLIVADIRFSRTAAWAKEWVGIAPGSHGALALGIAYVMLRERLYDADFVNEHLFGFEDFQDERGKPHTGFRSLVLRDYSPEVVSRLTGVPVDRILELGKTFGESPAPLALFDENVTTQSGGLHAALAIHSLNLLKGNLNRRGGLFIQPDVPLTPLSPKSATGSIAHHPLIVEDLADLVSAKEGVDVLFLYYSNPVYSSPFAGEVKAALDKIPLVVSFSPFLDETSNQADFILPDTLFMERWEDRLFPPSSPAPGWSLVQPCAPPAGKTRHSGDVLLDLAQRLGSPLSEAFPWKNFQELLKHRARGLYESHSGTLCFNTFQQGLVGEMERRGWWISSSETFEEFWDRLLAAGAWTDPNHAVRNLQHYSGHADKKIDLYCRTLRGREPQNQSSSPDIECLPHFHSETKVENPLTFPMVLNHYRLGKLGGGTNAALPWILQQGGSLDHIAWNSWAEVHPEDARAHGIGNLDWIWVESPSGKLRVRAVISRGSGRGVVTLPNGLGHSEMGRWAKGRGVSPVRLLSAARDPISGLIYKFGTRVKIYKA